MKVAILKVSAIEHKTSKKTGKDYQLIHCIEEKEGFVYRSYSSNIVCVGDRVKAVLDHPNYGFCDLLPDDMEDLF